MSDFQIGDVVILKGNVRAAPWAKGAATFLTVKGFDTARDVHGHRMLIFKQGAFPFLFGDDKVSPVWFELVKRTEKKIKNLPTWW